MQPAEAQRQAGPNGLLASLSLWMMILAAVALILAWGAAQKGPTHWDDSWYLAAAVRLYDRFAGEGVAGYWRGFQYALDDKAPLITLLPFPFFLLIGRSVFVAYLVNSVACVILALALYSFCRRFFSARVAALAVFFALTAPLLAGLSRLFLVEYWLTAVVVTSCWALARWEETGQHRWLLWVGVLCGLGLLLKITFPIFFAPVAAAILWRKHGKDTGRLLADMALVGIPLLVLAGPWYWHNWEAVTHRSFQETWFVAPHEVAEHPSTVGLAVGYLSAAASHGVSAVPVLAAAGGLLAWALKRRDNFLGAALFYVVPWVIALPVFAISENRDLRLIAPMVPAFSIVAAALFDVLLTEWRRLGPWLIAAAVVGSVGIVLASSFTRFGGRAMGYSYPPNPNRWPLDEVLDRVANRERLGPRSKLIVALGADTWSFNSNNLGLAATLSKYPIEFYTTNYTSQRDEAWRLLSTAQYFLWKDGGTETPPSRFRGGPLAIEFVTKGPLYREVGPAIAAPDGGRIRIFENAAAGRDTFFPASLDAPRPDLDPVDLNFGNYLQVKGLRVAEQGGVYTLRLLWRCLNPPPRPYRCFAHIIDPQGKILARLDHEILHASPPVDEWQPGDEGYEARYMVLPAAAARGTRLQLGLFDSHTDLRVPLWASTLPLKDGYTAAIVEPNQAPGDEYPFRMEPAPWIDCDVEFEQGVRLTGYSLRRTGEVAWLRLRWTAAERPEGRLHFFGHAVADQSPDSAILLSFDQDTAFDRVLPGRDGKFAIVQDVLRDISKLPAHARLLRVGLFDMENPNDRLAIRRSSLPMSKRQKAIYLPLPPPSGS